MKKRSLGAIGVIIGVIMLSMVSGGIYFSEINSKYNLGDMIELKVKVDPIEEGRLLKVSLICVGKRVIEFNNFPENGEVNIKLPLNFYTIQEVNGNCYFSGEYSGELRNTGEFEISKKLNVRLLSDSFFINPGENVVISGEAERLNKIPINGEVEITIPLLKSLEIIQNEQSSANIEFNKTTNETENSETKTGATEEFTKNAGTYFGKVEDGKFSVPLSLREETPAGDYRIDVSIYEEISGQKASEGVAIANLKVFQVLKSIDLVLNNQNFNPGTKVEIKPILLDQTGTGINDDISVIIKNDNGNRIFERIVKSYETIGFNIPTNLTSGYYEIVAKKGEFNSLKKFYVNEKEIASFELVNNTLIVTNIGNIPYEKDIQVELNGKPFIKEMNLALGESKEFKLTGSNEEYNVKVSDGENEVSKSRVMLTGRAAAVNSVDEKSSLNFVYGPIIWIFFIVVLGIGILFLLRNIFKKKSYAYFSDKQKKKIGEERFVKEDSNEILKNKKTLAETKKIGVSRTLVPPSQAEKVLVMKGHKTPSVVLVLKIRNKIGKLEKQSLEKAIEHVYEKRGAVYEQGDFIYIIFSPLMTHLEKNEVEAVKVAEKISMVLAEHNKKYKDKIDFGIGINSGEIINKIEDKKLKFTTLGNFIVSAKRLAESSKKQILVTKESYEKGISQLKTEKIKVGDSNVYQIKGVVDREKNQKFIDGFLKRMEKDNASQQHGFKRNV